MGSLSLTSERRAHNQTDLLPALSFFVAIWTVLIFRTDNQETFLHYNTYSIILSNWCFYTQYVLHTEMICCQEYTYKSIFCQKSRMFFFRQLNCTYHFPAEYKSLVKGRKAVYRWLCRWAHHLCQSQKLSKLACLLTPTLTTAPEEGDKSNGLGQQNHVYFRLSQSDNPDCSLWWPLETFLRQKQRAKAKAKPFVYPVKVDQWDLLVLVLAGR